MSDYIAGIEMGPLGEVSNNNDLVRQAQSRQAEAERLALAALDWRMTVRRRVAALGLLLLVWAVGIEARLVILQVVERGDLMARAERQRSRTIKIPGKRGELLDRDGRVLAYSVDGDAVFAEPALVRDASDAAARVCGAIEGCGSQDRALMTERLRQRKAFVYLWRRASPADAERVRALRVRGVGILREDRRYYPSRELSAHVLGYVGTDGNGLGGVEAAFEEQIAGQPGTMLLLTDAKQNAFGRVQRPPTAGATLELTIDSYLQYIAERELASGMEEFGARGGTALIMDPRTGDVLALANVPTFNPNAYNLADENHRRNRAVQEVYEPGSTFKIVTASAALETRAVRPNEMVDVSRGSISFGARTIRDVHRYGALSFADVIVKSSNVGAILIGQRIGAAKMAEYVRAFGFGQTSLRELNGESRGIVWDVAHLNASALASVSMGYQIGVTPIQMVTAASAVANGGELVAPRLVRAVIKGGRRLEVPRRVDRRPITPETAATLTTIMEGVVEEGTGKAARIDGYTVAGKTGTAAKLENGRYSKSDYNASFVGFLPSRAPALTILVVVDSPHGKGYYGGAVAAPIFKRIAERALQHLGIGPTLNPDPPMVVTREGTPAPLVGPRPARTPGLIPFTTLASASGLMPDLRGMSARDAVQALTRLGLVARISGDGLVVDQEIPPGASLERGGSCALRLARLFLPAEAEAEP